MNSLHNAHAPKPNELEIGKYAMLDGKRNKGQKKEEEKEKASSVNVPRRDDFRTRIVVHCRVIVVLVGEQWSRNWQRRDLGGLHGGIRATGGHGHAREGH